jgi:signal transduction histidine kinase/CheY-like chemotaxis protein/PAS domain-containing protein
MSNGSLFSVLPLVQAVLAASLGIVVLSARRRNRSHVPFGIFLIGIGAWGALIFLMRTAADAAVALRWERWLVPLSLLMSALLHHFVALWSRPGRHTPSVALAYLQIAVGLASVLGPLVIAGMRPSIRGYTPLPGQVFALWSVACLWPVGLGLARLVYIARTTHDAEERNRVAYMLAGVIICFIGGIFDLLPILGLPGTPGLVIGILGFCGLTTFAILRHDLLAIRTALRTILAAAAASVIVAVPMLGAAYLLALALRYPVAGSKAGLLALAAAIFLATPPLWQFVRRHIDRRLLGRRWDHLEAVERLIREIQPLADTADMARVITERLSRYFTTSAVSLLVAQEGSAVVRLAASTLPGTEAIRLDGGRVLARWLAAAPNVVGYRGLEETAQVQRAFEVERPVFEALRAELLVPLGHRGRNLAGLLVLGPRERDRAYGLEDRRLLSALSGPLAAVLDNQRRYLEAMRSRADLERWLNGMGEGVIIVDADHRVRFVNAAAGARLDIHEGDACGELAGPGARLDGTGELQRYEFVREGVTWEASAAPLANPDETSSRIIVVRDLTERQRRVQELMRAERLESLALLAGGIAHDFNNILTAILGNLELAKHRAESDESQQRRLAAAGAACGRAKRLTGQLLTFSRGGAPVTKPLDIGRLLVETVGFAISGSTVRHELHIPGDLWPALADEGQIAQVVSNLVINAVQAMPQGGTLRIEAANEPAPPEVASTGRGTVEGAIVGRGFLRITFADEGIGIPPEHLERVFDPWFTSKPGGSGLGLAVVHEIIRRHRGRVEVDSSPGRGTVFTIRLPAASESAPVSTGLAYEHHGRGCILLMDDDPTVRDVTAALLGQLGYEVSLASDGAEAVRLHAHALAAGRSFAATLLDLTVPGGMGGVEAARRLRAAEPGVRLVATSGYASDSAPARHREHGFAAFLSKPFTIEDLSCTLAGLAGADAPSDTSAPEGRSTSPHPEGRLDG